MADVLLSDFLGYLFGEISAAREMADRQSKDIAQRYGGDDVLRHFAVPRFKLAKLDLTVPVLVSGVQLSSLAQLRISRGELGTLIVDKAVEVASQLPTRQWTQSAVRTDGLEPLIDAFHRQLGEIVDPAKLEEVVAAHWPALVARVLDVNEVPAPLARAKATSELIARAQRGLTDTLRARISIAHTALQKVLVNPETHAVKEGSGGAVFALRAELVEEGVIVRRVKDERTGAETAIVDFE